MFKELFQESADLVSIDIQPSSDQFLSFKISDFIHYLNNYKGKIYYIFNGPELGFDDEDELKEWLYYNELKDETFDRIEFIEKDYGWLRDAIDSGYSNNDIIEVLKLMIKKDSWDSRDLETKDLNKLNISEDFKEVLVDEEINLSLPYIIKEIKKLPKTGIIIGGGENECLLEMQLLTQAMNKKYKTNKKFVY